MRAWVIDRTVPTAGPAPLRPADLPPPVPSAREVRLRVLACGVCRTDLHLLDGDVPAHGPRVVPGHEIVGVVDGLGVGCERFRLGERVGVAWLRGTCGACRFCIRGDENLCVDPRFTGWDADGGYAEHAWIDERFAYRLPAKFSDRQAAHCCAPASSATAR